jgi:hypothetical protein
MNPSLLLLYGAKIQGLVHREEIVPILIDLETMETKEAAPEWLLKQLTEKPSMTGTPGSLTSGFEAKVEKALAASEPLWNRLFEQLNNEWIKRDGVEHERRKRILDNSLNRIYLRTKSAIESQTRRLITLDYIQQYPNVDRLPDGTIDVSRIAGTIENSPDMRDVFIGMGIRPPSLKIRGEEVRSVARSFRTAKQRQALHLQILKAREATRSEYGKYRKLADRIEAEKKELEKQHGKQATHTLMGAAVLLPAQRQDSQ